MTNVPGYCIDPPPQHHHDRLKSSHPVLWTVLVTSMDQYRPALSFTDQPFPFKSKLRKASWGWVMTPAPHPPSPDPGEMPEE